MDASDVLRSLEPLKPRFSELGIERLWLVGSVAKGDSRPDSDVDFVVEFKVAATFLGYMELLELLGDTLGRKIDLATKRSLRPEIAEDVMSGARLVA